MTKYNHDSETITGGIGVTEKWVYRNLLALVKKVASANNGQVDDLHLMEQIEMEESFSAGQKLLLAYFVGQLSGEIGRTIRDRTQKKIGLN
jgi:hypothetical protein